MKKLQFSIDINAPKEKVWDILWTDESYRAWTSVFHEGSHAKSDWKEGSRIYFVDNDGSGMFSIIDKLVPNEQMTFKHLGEVKNGEEITTEWAGAEESYFLNSNNGSTALSVTVEMSEEFCGYFENTFPKALQLVKQLSEAQ
jgi:uncharacterized protein YndB with AHSA1/START domain